MRADSTYARSKAGYGTRASSLLAKGLSDSGYGDYLEAEAYAQKQRSIDSAARAKEKRDSAGYAAYLEKAESESDAAYTSMTKGLDSAFAKLLSEKITDKEAAVTFLTTLGVDEENARLLAEKNDIIIHSTQERRNAVLSFALKNELRFERAYSYALANGLSKDDAKEIASISQSARDVLLGNQETYEFDISKYEEYLK